MMRCIYQYCSNNDSADCNETELAILNLSIQRGKKEIKEEIIAHHISKIMSRASKITLGLTTLFTATIVVGVHHVQELERQTLHQGPIKDAQRVAEKKLARQNGVDPEKERQRMVNKNEHEYQLELRKKYEQMQPLSGEVRTKDNELIEQKK